MKVKYLISSCIALIGCALGSCSSSNDELSDIILPEDQPASLTLPANQNSESINFIATSSWSAWTSTESRSVGDVEWIHLNDTHGDAGEITLNFTLDYNNTGESRTAYIIIECEDSRIGIPVTQTVEEDPDIPGSTLISGCVEISVDAYDDMSGLGYTHDGTTKYLLKYEFGRLVEMISVWRDDMVVSPDTPADHDSYCMNVQTASFLWTETSVKADIRNDVTYYPSERTEVEDSSEHYAEIVDGRAVGGWYRWAEDPVRTDWEATYDDDGYLVSTRNNDASAVWDTYAFTWEDGKVKRIVSSGDRVLTFTYADPTLVNLHRQFDLNWVLPSELECYDFAAGDITRIFASAGYLGEPSKLLITSISESDGTTTYSYRMTYKENTRDRTVVTVTYFVNDVQTSYKDWIIQYSNIE